ncbi:unnamed protein product [Chondrus crispus]|uniref:UDENN domain-containing protein n=1 Tax=Chondrus crispus TaxID=2769 RepID=R7QRZ6_CHOCR|nr:unnamed protein product [Chondrus crispus]CDF41267.1 unnamed protein product [Chondrus crispus]|eukprot:XP_005711561.1 unnamed protein product [Chondrus crispus]
MPLTVPLEPSLDSLLSSPSYDALLLAAIVQRCPGSHTRPSLQLLHAVSPHHSPSSPTFTSARDALLAAAPFIFPSDIPHPSSDSDSDLDTDCDTDPQVSASSEKAPSEAPPLKLTPTASSTPVSPTDFDPAAQLDRAVESSRTLPLSSVAVFDALAESSPRIPCKISSISWGPQADAGNDSPRRANSLPRRPNSSPPPRLRSLGLPGYTRSRDSGRRDNGEHMKRDPRAHSKLSMRFRHLLLEAQSHVFAMTARDGSRQYVYCRSLAPNHTLVVVTLVSFTAVYVSALEHTAARYVLLVDERSVEEPRAGRQMSESTRFLTFQLMRCPAEVAKLLVRNLFEWLKASTCPRGQSEKCHSLLKRARLRFLSENVDADFDGSVGNRPSATFPTSSSTSSGGSLGARDGLPRRLSTTTLLGLPPEWDTNRFFARKDSASGGSNGPEVTEIRSLPWEVAAECDGKHLISTVTRVLELTDATLLFRHFQVRAIMSVIVALLEERRVCIVGPDTAIVSRAVVAFDNLLRPFEWPHLLSPILLEHMLPVLGAPFPFLVGILGGHMSAARNLPLGEVIFASLETGKVTSTQESAVDLHRRIPRKVRMRFERRLLRAKNACLRQVNRSMPFPFVPNVSNTASSYFEDRLFSPMANRMKSSGLWRSKSQLRLYNEANPQNIWLECETVDSLDRYMRKFFAELLSGTSTRERRGTGELPAKGENLWKSVPNGNKFASLRRDADRQQLAKAFRETPLFMHWEELDSANMTFGILKSEASQVRKRSTLREKMLSARDSAAADEDSVNDDSAMDMLGASDLECYEEIGDDFMVNVGDVSIWNQSRNKKLRMNRNRLHFSDEVEEFGSDNSDLQSEVEPGFMKKEARSSGKPRRRNVSTDCIPDVDTSVKFKPQKGPKGVRGKARRRQHARKDLLVDLESLLFLKENIRSIPRARRRNASTDCIPDVEPMYPIEDNGRPLLKQHRRTATTDCVSTFDLGLLAEVSPPTVQEEAVITENRLRSDTDDWGRGGAARVPIRSWRYLRIPPYLREVGERRLVVSPNQSDDCDVDKTDEDGTEVEETDEETLDRLDIEGSACVFPSEDAMLSKNHVRAWGRRRARHSRVY